MQTTTKYQHFWGIDVSKNWVDIAMEGTVTRVEQTEKALTDFITSHQKEEATLCVMESTGGYEKGVARYMRRAGITVHIAHPNKVVSFAKARGRLAKTDAIDARVLADYGQFLREDEIREGVSIEQESLQMLGARLEQLKAMLHQETCRHGMAQERYVKDSIEQVIKMLKEQIKETQQHIMEMIEANDELHASFKRLTSMKGIGIATAISLIVDLPELGYINKKQIAALVGVAPITRQSGLKTGKSFIKYGRAMVRKVLYMAALVACRHNERMKTFYERLVNAGKQKKVALVAVMRKMLITLNAMMRTKTCFQA